MRAAFFRYLASAITVERSIDYVETFSKDRRKDQFLDYAYENFVRTLHSTHSNAAATGKKPRKI